MPIESLLERAGKYKGENEGRNVLLELAIDDIRKDLEFAMWMCSETSFGRDAIFVDDAKATKLFVVPILISVDGPPSQAKADERLWERTTQTRKCGKSSTIHGRRDHALV